MTTEPRTIRMGIAPGFARYLRSAVEDTARTLARLPDSDRPTATSLLVGTDPSEAVDTFTNTAVTLIIAQWMLDNDVDGYVDDYALRVVPREQGDDA